MGTRSIIGVTTDDTAFEGRYCHWDGYPSAKVAQLIEAYAELDQDWEKVRDYAIKPGQTGYWSSFGAPSYVAERAALPELVPCTYCTDDPGFRTWPWGPNGSLVREKCNGCVGSGNPVGLQRNSERSDTWRSNNGDSFVTNLDDCGAEWAYLLSEKGINVVASLREDGSKAIGMFGSIGDIVWASAGFIPWTAHVEEIDFDHLECGANYEHCNHYAWAHFPEAEGTRVGTGTWLGRNDPHHGEIHYVVRNGVKLTLTGSGSTGTAQDSEAWRRSLDLSGRTPRYWWASVKDEQGNQFDIRLFRILKAGYRLERGLVGFVPTEHGNLSFTSGTVLS